MPAFRVSGATGQAPTTSFFCPVADLGYNCMNPGHEITSNIIHDSNKAAANNINQWTIFNTAMFGGANANSITLGAMTTAPDGTTSAQKIVEAAMGGASSKHYLTAIAIAPGDRISLRLAVFLKAAERTRAVLVIGQGGYQNGQGLNGVRTVFDLANGVVAVPGVVAGAQGWLALGDTILSFGNGWFCCMIDVGAIQFFASSRVFGYCFIDKGTGNAAENSNYVGDGSSGIYTWRATMLPPDVWGMSGQNLLFDGFDDNTMAEFDLTNSKAPGFLWYKQRTWPLFYGTQRAVTGDNVANSELNLPSANTQVNWSTAAWLGPDGIIPVWTVGATFASGALTAYNDPVAGTTLYQSLQNGNIGNTPSSSPSFWSPYVQGFVGKTFIIPPGLVESVVRYSAPTGGYSPYFQALSTLLTTQETNTPNVKFGPGYRTNYWEFDTFEGGWFTSVFNAHRDQCSSSSITNETSLHTADWAGFTLWNSTAQYQTGGPGFIVGFNGQLYQNAVGGSNIGNQPDISPSFWNVYDPSTNGTQINTAAGTNVFDQTAKHRYGVIITPYRKDKDPCGSGQVWTFFDRIAAQQAPDNTPPNGLYSPVFGQSDSWRSAFPPFDGTPMVLVLGGGPATFIDSVALIK